MADDEKVADLLHEAAETHHRVLRITDDADEDWDSWPGDWLTSLSETAVGAGRQTRPQRTGLLAGQPRQGIYRPRPDEPWESYYVRRVIEHAPAADPGRYSDWRDSV